MNIRGAYETLLEKMGYGKKDKGILEGEKDAVQFIKSSLTNTQHRTIGDFYRNASTNGSLETAARITAAALFIGSFIFLLPNLTGNVVINVGEVTSSFWGVELFLGGLVFGLMSLRKS